MFGGTGLRLLQDARLFTAGGTGGLVVRFGLDWGTASSLSVTTTGLDSACRSSTVGRDPVWSCGEYVLALDTGSSWKCVNVGVMAEAVG
jgi:hypothetical protein